MGKITRRKCSKCGNIIRTAEELERMAAAAAARQRAYLARLAGKKSDA